MPKRTDIQSILVLGAGPIVIGQGCEFDYSGTQACKALKEEGYRIILVNSNPATIMTDPDLADATYIEPLTIDIISKIIAKERPDALLPTMGGQTALNLALSLKRSGILDRYNVEMIGASANAIDKAEDRALFRSAMKKIGLETPKSMLANATDIKSQDRQNYEQKQEHLKESLKGDELSQALEELEREWQQNAAQRKQRYITYATARASEALDYIGLPAIIRPSFTLGGTGGGIAYNRSEFFTIIEQGLEASPTTEVLIEESVLNWKEYEMEVVRDKKDNCIIVCSIENIDPMGVHTGDSITVAPALTLTDKEYQIMRNAAIAVLREIGVETGGSNVQFAVNPKNGRLVVIEMNPRVSRSSALASKATGFPIAKIAAKLAVGYSLDELQNEITKGTMPAAFEPSIDYIVTKIPRFAFDKFPGASPLLTTSMKSVGEVMAIGRSFPESLQKALRSLETGLSGLDEIAISTKVEGDAKDALKAAIALPSPDRLRYIAQAMRDGLDFQTIAEISKIDPWFLEQIENIIKAERKIKKYGLPQDAYNFRQLKALGFCDQRLASLANISVSELRHRRDKLAIAPVFKRIDSCAAEFASATAYMYSCYEEPFLGQAQCEAQISERPKIIILGSGPNRIGQGIEFDYCCCHASFALREAGYETIMVNCNPETVSTDYDTSDRLYFEPLTDEDLLEIVKKEAQKGQLCGVIVQFGGQTPLKLAKSLEQAQIPILGTKAEIIDLAEDRDRFQQFLQKLDLKQPPNALAYNIREISEKAQQLGYPLLIRPSYVLGGRAMQIIRNQEQLELYIADSLRQLVTEDSKINKLAIDDKAIDNFLAQYPLLLDSYLAKAVEVDVDCLSDGEQQIILGIMEHIEEAGIHSGDSACSLPPHELDSAIIERLKEQSLKLAKALNIVGLMNVQFAIKGQEIYILEANPRASRTIPFVAKTTGSPVAKIAARVMAGEKLQDLLKIYKAPNDLSAKPYKAVKEAVFPFSRFANIDPLLGPEMRSTGEVMGIDLDFPLAFAKSQLAAQCELPIKGNLYVSIKDEDKLEMLPSIAQLYNSGFTIYASSGTQQFLKEHNICASKINKVYEGHPHIEDKIRNRQIQLIFNTTKSSAIMTDSHSIRRAALMQKIPYYTTIAGAKAASQAILAMQQKEFEPRSIQEYYGLNKAT